MQHGIEGGGSITGDQGVFPLSSVTPKPPHCHNECKALVCM